MTMISATLLSKLPFALQEQAHEALACLLVKADKGGAKLDRMEKALVRYLSLEWQRTANQAVNSAMSTVGSGEGQFSEGQAKQVMSRLDSAFKNFNRKISKRIIKDFETIYVVNKARFVSRFEIVPMKEKKVLRFRNFDNTLKVVKSWNKITKDIPPPAFAKLDELTWENLSRLTLTSIGDHFPTELKPLITKTIQESVLARGMNKEDAGKFLQKELTRVLGSTNQAVPPSVMEAGQERVNNYFKGLAQTNLNFARNFGQITAMQEAEIARYEIVAIIDNLTTVICQGLNGRIFELSLGVEHRDKVLEMESVDELKEFAPWQKNLDAFDLAPGKKLEDPGAARVLAAAGMSLPPYHFRCRSEVHPA